MRKKIYYLLIPIYFATFAFILYMNGVFTGNLSSVSNLVINVGFLVLMGVLLLMSIRSFASLGKCVEELKKQIYFFQKDEGEEGKKEYREQYLQKKDIFSHPALNHAFLCFERNMRKHKTRFGYDSGCEISDYINEDLLEGIGKNHFNSNMPGTLTGLGILGTFLGLSMGLSSFSGNDLMAVSDNMGMLLEGMKVAFHTSVYGIFFSLVFSFIYRSIMAETYGVLEEYLVNFQEFMLPLYEKEGEEERALVIYQASMANSMKQILELLKGEHRSQAEAVESIVTQVKSQLLGGLGEDLRQLGCKLKTATDSQTTIAGSNRELVKAVEMLLLANRDLQEKMEKLELQQEGILRDLKQEKRELEKTCLELTKEISGQLYAYDRMRD